MHTRLLVLLSIIALVPVMAFAKMPSDPFAWQWAYEDIFVYDAWDLATGSDEVVVAVIDNGVDVGHPDLADNIWVNTDEVPDNGKDDDNNGFIDDIHGWNFVDDNPQTQPHVSALTDLQKESGIYSHGTVVAGIIGAVGDNGIDGVGINWDVQIMPVKVLGNSGEGQVNSLPTAIDYAVDNGADVINISMVTTQYSSSLEAAIKKAYDLGVVVIAAAGNDLVNLNASPYYPICIDENADEQWVLGVSAIRESHHIATFSNTGSDCIDITAPGVNISSTIRYAPEADLDVSYEAGWHGTSFAAPLVTGAAALVKSINPHWGPDEIYETLLTTVHHTPGQDETIYANLFGAGLLQIDKAVAYAMEKSLQAERFISSVLTYQPETGRVSERKESSEDFAFSKRFALVDIDDAAFYTSGDTTMFATAKHDPSTKTVHVAVFNQSWHKIKSWEAPASGPVQVELADTMGDDKLEVVIVPDYADDEVVRVFDLDGQMLGSHSIDGVHQGVSVATIHGISEEKDEIGTLYLSGESMTIGRYSGNADPEQQSDVGYIEQRGALGVGDIDGDGEKEYVVGAGVDEDPFLIYYELDGTFKRKFWAYDPSYKGGLDIAVGDYNYDGKEDVVIAPLAGGVPVRVWTNKSKRIGQWTPFSEPSPYGQKLLLKF